MDEHPSVRKRLSERNALGARIRPITPDEWIAELAHLRNVHRH